MKNISSLLIAITAVISVNQANAQTAATDTRMAGCSGNSCSIGMNTRETVAVYPASTYNTATPATMDSIATTIKPATTVTGFSGVKTSNSVILTWVTQEESDAAKFIIEKSNDGTNWQTFATVDATANSNTADIYYYGDTKPYITGYYRLKPVDNNGTGVYSKTLVVTAVKKKK